MPGVGLRPRGAELVNSRLGRRLQTAADVMGRRRSVGVGGVPPGGHGREGGEAPGWVEATAGRRGVRPAAGGRCGTNSLTRR